MTAVDGPGMSRRGLLAAALGAGALGVAGCGQGTASPGGSADAGPLTVPVSRVPVGGAVVIGAVLVSQPTAGAFKAFSAVCTHQQCLVTQVQGATAECPCHGSLFSTVDGAALRGPAARPLSPRTVTVSGDTLTVT